AAMRTSLITGHATIAATFLPGRTPPDLAPILAVHDGRRREMFLLSRSGDLVLFRTRRRTDVLGFHSPTAILAHALPPDLTMADTVSSHTMVEPAAVTLDLAVHGPQHHYALHRRVGPGVWDTWRIFLSDDGRWARHADLITFASMVMLFWPLGYWAARAAPREGTLTSLAAALMPL